MSIGLSFSDALDAVRHGGRRVARKGWNGKGMWVALVKPGSAQMFARTPLEDGRSASMQMMEIETFRVELPFTLIMRTADGSFVAWLASQSDILADDWEVL
jgi:hypothetical protein